ncbi:tetratricopeptide repeat protein [Streptomyces zhihengii]
MADRVPAAGTAIGFAVEHHRGGLVPDLPGARAQLETLAALLTARGCAAETVADPDWGTVRDRLGAWAGAHAETGGGGPAVVLWSGHAELHRDRLHLITADTEDPAVEEQVYRTELLTGAALRSGADQVLLVVDTCHSGAGVLEPLRRALEDFAATSLPPGRAQWLGVLASCQSGERAAGRGVLLDTLTAVLRDGPPGTGPYRHAWSARNEGVTGEAVLQAVLARWDDDGQRPVGASTGRALPMFRNPRLRRDAGEQVVEHLVLAARGAGRTEEGWFFTGRHAVLRDIVGRLGSGEPGLLLVTGGAGSGKSAVLGRVATLSDPRRRAEVRAHGALREGDPDPGENTVDAALHLRGTTPQGLAEALAARLGLPVPRTPAALIAELEQREAGRPPVLVLDGLDEAGDEAADVAEQLLVPLSRVATVLLASRARPFRPHTAPEESLDGALSRWLGARVSRVDLDEEPDTEQDIAGYARRRLERGGLPPDVAEAAARSVAERAAADAGGFLFARLVTRSLVARFDGRAPGALPDLPRSVGAAFAEELARGPVRVRDGAELPRAATDLLTALARSAGRGMPARGVWECAAAGLGGPGTAYGPEDVDWLLNAYGAFVVEDTDGIQAVYRLYHREFVEHLRNTAPAAGEPVTRALVGLLLRQSDGAREPERANPYLLTGLAAHALDAGPAGIVLVRDLERRNGGAFRPVLALVLRQAAVLLAGTGRDGEAVAAAREAAALQRELAAADPGPYRPGLAHALDGLAHRLAATGDRAGALEAAREAADVQRELAAGDPDAFAQGLPSYLVNLATRLSEAGEPEAATAVTEEAVGLCRRLADRRPSVHLPLLAQFLMNHAAHLGAAGRYGAALAACEEAVAVARALAAEAPAAHLFLLAAALGDLAVCLDRVGRGAEALAAAEESVDLHRAPAADRPGDHLPRLAKSLGNLAVLLGSAGRAHDALVPAAEGLAAARRVAEDDPDSGRAVLSDALGVYAGRLLGAGEHRESLVHVQEAVALDRALAADDPVAGARRLALSLSTLATALGRQGDYRAALAAGTESVELLRPAAGREPVAHLAELALCLNNLGNQYAEAGDTVAAIEATTEALDLYRSLAAALPGVHLGDLAQACDALGNRLSDLGAWSRALPYASGAVDLYRQLAAEQPARYGAGLARALSNLGIRLACTGAYEEALAVTRESLDMETELTAGDPKAGLTVLSGTWYNLSLRLSETSRTRESLAAVREAVRMFRELAEDEPGHWTAPLGSAVGTLGRRLSELGDHGGARAAGEEAVALLTACAEADPRAHVSALTEALAGLELVLGAAGDPGALLAPVLRAERAVAGHPAAHRRLRMFRLGFLLRSGPAEDAVRELVSLVCPDRAGTETESGTGTGTGTESESGTGTERDAGGAGDTREPDPAHVFQARQLLRHHAGRGRAEARLVRRLVRQAGPWAARTPDWLDLPAHAMDTLTGWFDCEDWASSRAYWDGHRWLRSRQAGAALRELTLIQPEVATHLELWSAAVRHGPDLAFHLHLLVEHLDTWAAAGTLRESRDLLVRHAGTLVDPNALVVLTARSGTTRTLRHALLHLAVLDGVEDAYRCAEDRAALRRRIERACSGETPDTETLDLCAVLERNQFGDAFAADVHRAVAAILSGEGTGPPVAAAPGPEARTGAVTEIAALIGRYPRHTAELTALLRSVVAEEPVAPAEPSAP